MAKSKAAIAITPSPSSELLASPFSRPYRHRRTAWLPASAIHFSFSANVSCALPSVFRVLFHRALDYMLESWRRHGVRGANRFGVFFQESPPANQPVTFHQTRAFR